MRLLTVGENEAGQRLLRLLEKYMDKAPKSFFYKMLRKKNITLNGKKAQGNEYLSKGDEIRLFLSDETIDGFSSAAGRGMPGMNSLAGSEVPRGEALRGGQLPPWQKSTQKLTEKLPENLRPEIIYEDRHVILFNKPAGLLSQKAVPSDVSLVEYLTAYLLESGQIAEEELRSFRPGICSRLDRNTSGLVAAGKSLRGLQELNELFRTRSLHKFYRTIAVGTIAETRRAEGWLLKNERTNQVQILREKREGHRGSRDLSEEGGIEVNGMFRVDQKTDILRLRAHPFLGGALRKQVGEEQGDRNAGLLSPQTKAEYGEVTEQHRSVGLDGAAHQQIRDTTAVLHGGAHGGHGVL